MKERWDRLTRVQKWLMFAAALLAVVFAIVYAVNAPRQGMAYGDDFLTFSRKGEERRYTGRSEGAEVTFTVTGDTVTSQWGGETHTYTVTPCDLPEGEIQYGEMLGVEVREGNTLLFRGGWYPNYGFLVNENGETEDFLSIRTNFDPPMREPSVGTVLKLWHGPKLTSRVHSGFYFMGLLLAVLAAVELFFAEDLFRWRLSWAITDPYGVEANDWELFSRTFAAVVMLVIAVICWTMGWLDPIL